MTCISISKFEWVKVLNVKLQTKRRPSMVTRRENPRNTQKQPETARNTQKLPEIPRNTQKQPETPQNSETTRNSQKHPKTHRNTQKQPETTPNTRNTQNQHYDLTNVLVFLKDSSLNYTEGTRKY